MGIMDFDPSAMFGDVSATGLIAQTSVWLGLFLWVGIFIFLGFYFVRFVRYKIPINLYEEMGGAIIQKGQTKAMEINKNGTTRYEIRTWLGLISPKKKEYYYNPSSEYKIPTKKGFGFNLLRIGFNAYNPIKTKVYTNTLDKIKFSLKQGFGRKAEVNPKKPHEEKSIYMKKDTHTYIPIKFDSVPVEFEIIPQNLLPHLARSLQENVEMFNTPKWWEPYLLPFSIFIFCALQIIVMGWMFDKVGGVGGACQIAERRITDTLAQRI